MSDNKQIEQVTDPIVSVSAFGYELIRDILLPELLGKETPAILYWAGKGLARKFPLDSIEQVVDFFEQAGWGTLSLIEHKKNELEFELSSELITRRFKIKDDCSFQLEAGFLAQQIESQRKTTAEAYEHPKKRAGKVIFTVKWDKKDVVD
ncbi:YslB family protein [Cytobacillus sp. FJAT-54145]|uniref:YslB family protein n=1 Tax=Cytobacillus spartinae TaxID=3299023 RepID=A0ABW6KLR6_9BACI